MKIAVRRHSVILIVTLVSILFTSAALLAASPSHAAPQPARQAVSGDSSVLARHVVYPSRPTSIRARNGVKLYVPAHVVRHRTSAVITRVGRGRFDVHIVGHWTGRVLVTVPLARHHDGVAHDLGRWVVESKRYGQRSVWVRSLSVFSTMSSLGSKFCLTINPKAFLTCLVLKGVKSLDHKLAIWLAEALHNSCLLNLIVDDFYGPGDVAIGAFTGPCVGHAGDPTPSPSPTPTPPPPPPPTTWGFHIDDYFFGGTWARNDPNDGTWYSSSNPPPNSPYWYPNGLGVAVDCARVAAGYSVHFADGHYETWYTWLHVTDGEWFPSAVADTIYTDGLNGITAC